MAEDEGNAEGGGEEASEGTDEGGGGKSKKKLIIIAVIGVIVLLGAGAGVFMALSGGEEKPEPEVSAESEESASEEDDSAEEKDEEKEGEEKKEGEENKEGEEKKEGEEGATTDEKKSEEEKIDIEFGDTIQMKTFNLNLGNALENRFVRMEVTLEYNGGESQKQEIEKRMAQLRDAVITVVSRKTREFLLAPDGKDALRKEILIRINRYMKQKIEAVYITDILIE